MERSELIRKHEIEAFTEYECEVLYSLRTIAKHLKNVTFELSEIRRLAETEQESRYETSGN